MSSTEIPPHCSRAQREGDWLPYARLRSHRQGRENTGVRAQQSVADMYTRLQSCRRLVGKQMFTFFHFWRTHGHIMVFGWGVQEPRRRENKKQKKNKNKTPRESSARNGLKIKTSACSGGATVACTLVRGRVRTCMRTAQHARYNCTPVRWGLSAPGA